MKFLFIMPANTSNSGSIVYATVNIASPAITGYVKIINNKRCADKHIKATFLARKLKQGMDTDNFFAELVPM
jgi:hypothetical protein